MQAIAVKVLAGSLKVMREIATPWSRSYLGFGFSTAVGCQMYKDKRDKIMKGNTISPEYRTSAVLASSAFGLAFGPYWYLVHRKIVHAARRDGELGQGPFMGD